MDTREFLNNFGNIVSSPNGVQQIRELILQLAIQGRLVSQQSDELSADKILHEIKEERRKLIEDGSIKKQNSLPQIKEYEKPFSLPRGWAWSRLGHLITMEYGKGLPKKLRNAQGKIPVYGSNGVIGTHDQALIKKPSIIIGRKGSSGALNISLTPCWPTDVTYYVIPPKAIDLDFCFWLLKSLNLEELGKGIKPGLNRNEAYMSIVALPPYKEQKRIVYKVKNLFNYCDQLEYQQALSYKTREKANRIMLNKLAISETNTKLIWNWDRVNSNFKELLIREECINDLKATILQLAFRGKLVDQNSNHVPAKEFIKKIKNEVLEIRSKHGIKREKVKPKIFDIRLPYDLPRGWTWVRFPEIGFIGRGKSKHRPRNAPELFQDGIYPFVQTGDVANSVNGFIKKYSKKYNDRGLAQSKLWPAGTLCITIAANIAESGILSFEACFPDSVVGFVPAPSIKQTKYFEYFMRVAKTHLVDFAPSTAQKNINLTVLENLYIPFPPIEELNQIISKFEYLFGLCDELKSQIEDSINIQSKLSHAAIQTIIQSQPDIRIKVHETIAIKDTSDVEVIQKFPSVLIKLVKTMKKKIEDTVLAKLLMENGKSLEAKDLWQKSGLSIDEFYAILKNEIKEGFIAEPDVATLKLAEVSD